MCHFSEGQCEEQRATTPHRPALLSSRREVTSLAFVSGVLSSGVWPLEACAEVEAPAVTHRVYIDVAHCINAMETTQTRNLGELKVCAEAEPLGRIVIGLYGDLVPKTVENFIALATAPESVGLKGTVFHTVKKGEYVAAGRQGTRRLGQMEGIQMPPNPDTLSAKSFRIPAGARPGTVSLALTDYDKQEQRGRSEFAITTGPAPVPSLNDTNIVFGRVEEGMDVVAMVGGVDTYRPPERVRVMNDVAKVFGDDRAKTAKAIWSKPLQPVVILDCGVL